MKNKRTVIRRTALLLILLLVLSFPGKTLAAGPVLNLPSVRVASTVGPWFQGAVSSFDITLSQVPAGYDVTNGIYAGWCLEDNQKPNAPANTLVTLLDSTTNPAGFQNIPWDKVNYLLNHKSGTRQDVQVALWLLTGTYSGSLNMTLAAQVMFNDANANGGGFIPAPGQIVAVILDTDGLGGNFQDTIIEVTVPQPRRFTLGDRVWYDQDQDGRQDANEPGYNGVAVQLFNNATCTGSPMASTTTTAGPAGFGNGYYQFPNLLAGSYCIQFSGIPAGWSVSPANQGDNQGDSDADPGTIRITNINLTANNPDEDMGIYVPGTLGDNVMCVSTGQPLANITVNLYKDFNGDGVADGPVFKTAQTNASGFYQFTGLEVALAGGTNVTKYIVQVDTADPDLGGCSVPVPPTSYNPPLDSSNPNDPNNDFKFKSQPSSICGYVYVDSDNDGIRDAGEAPIPDVIVDLDWSTPVGALNMQTTTDSNGRYCFLNLEPGTYTVTETQPANYLDGKDTQGTPGTGTTGNDVFSNITLPAGFNGDNNNFGELPFRYTLGDRVWYDQNQNGIQDANEPGYPGGLTVSLYQGSTCSGGAMAVTTTSGSGLYQFTNLLAGTYSVGFSTSTLPSGWSVSPKDQGGNALDSDATAAGCIENINLTANDPDEDMGIYVPGTLGDNVMCVSTGLPLANITVNLFKDFNGDGVADGPVFKTVQTNASGFYQFTGLEVALAGGTNVTKYIVQVDTADPDLGGCNVPVPPTSYNPPLDSSKPSDPNNDFKFQLPPCQVTLGDRVWYDANLNGIQDANESGIDGVVLELLDGNGSPVLDANGNPITTTTANGGLYQFVVPCGSYQVKAKLPSGKTFTLTAVGNNRAVDSNPNPSPAPATPLPNGGEDKSIDFGLVNFQDLCPPDGTTGLPSPAGTLYWAVDANGDVYVRYDQSRGLNDNSYGTNIVQWPRDHKFGDLTGSDKAQFIFTDSTGKVVFDFYLDYISAKSGTPSGYASLGVTGGEGRVNVGQSAWVLAADTSIAKNLNNLGLCIGGNCSAGGTNLLVSSPPTISASSYTLPAGSPYTGWNFTNSYEVKVSKAAFGTSGFGNVTIGLVHNSPPKIGSNAVDPAPCVPDGGGVCSAQPVTGAIKSDFNGTSISSGRYIWFNSNFKVSGLDTSKPTVVSFSNGSILFNGQTLSVPDATIIFDPSAQCASTKFEGDMWVTTVPTSGSDEIFLSGLALPVTSNLPGGIKGVTWAGDFTADAPGVSVSWKWSAAVYTQMPLNANGTVNYNALNVKPTHTNACGINNSDHAGTPEAYKQYVIGGGRGGGGSNYTGSWSGTQSLNLVCDGGGAIQCNIVDGTLEVKDRQIKWALTNQGSSTVTLSSLSLVWPQANGQLFKVKLDGDVIWDAKAAWSPTGISLSAVNFTTDMKKKSINPGQTRQFTLEFEKNAMSDLTQYSGKLQFGSGCGLDFPPGTGSGCTGTMGNFVWNDANGNGLQDSNEMGLANVLVTLKLGGIVQTTATTGTDGTYQFAGLCAGNYSAEVSTPFGYSPTPVCSSDQAIGNDSNCSPAPVNLPTDNSSNQTIDFGFKVNPPGSGIPMCPATPITGYGSGQIGTLFITVEANGDISVRYDQSLMPGLNDNSYGVNIVQWPRDHKFGDLTGSDSAQFIFYNGAGAEVLNFELDYISTKSGTASGYASLGPDGGDGGMISGSRSNILSWDTSLAQNLNATGFCLAGNCTVGGVNLLLNSPPTIGSTSYTLPAGSPFSAWNFTNSYSVRISSAAFGNSGFGRVALGLVHNSPPKAGSNAVTPVPCP